MEFGTIEREIYVEASPEVVFEVVSSPEHLQQWWPDEAHYEPVPGSTGEIVFGEPRCRRGRWSRSPSSRRSRRGRSRSAGRIRSASRRRRATRCSSPSISRRRAAGTLLKMTETGFREMGWEVAVLEQQYHEHVTGWDFYLPRLVPYVATLAVRP